jgi:hypothetical protein
MDIVVGMAPLATKLCSFVLTSSSTLFWASLPTCLRFPLVCPLEFSKSPWKKEDIKTIIYLKNKISMHILR